MTANAWRHAAVIPTWKAPISMLDYLFKHDDIVRSRLADNPLVEILTTEKIVVAYDFEFESIGGLDKCYITELGWAVDGEDTFAMDVGQDLASANEALHERFANHDVVFLSWSGTNCDEKLFRRICPTIPNSWTFDNLLSLARTIWPMQGKKTLEEATNPASPKDIVFPTRTLGMTAAELNPDASYELTSVNTTLRHRW
ncbi:hypothetical protein HDU86_003158 [Geranomyces michiganensis]|nr:hypothetical protein HDU86_003158 [Geranomyces michiganensis]